MIVGFSYFEQPISNAYFRDVKHPTDCIPSSLVCKKNSTENKRDLSEACKKNEFDQIQEYSITTDWVK